MRILRRQVRGSRSLRRHAGAMALGAGALVAISSAVAQYSFNPAADHEQGPGIRYFGSAKDDAGAWVPDVTFLLASSQASFVFVTDAQGRFRGLLPLDIDPSDVTAKCWKAGLESVRVTKRPGPKVARSAVQVDCLLRRTASK